MKICFLIHENFHITVNANGTITAELDHFSVAAIDQPFWGQQRLSNELRKQDMFISTGEVRSVWLRYGLETFKKRLEALEAKVAQEGIILTEAQLAALEKKKDEQQSIGEIEILEKT